MQNKSSFVWASCRMLLTRYTPGGVLLLIASLAIMSFTDDRNGETGSARPGIDSAKTTRLSRHFKSLFGTRQYYDAANKGLFQIHPKAISFVNGYVLREEEEFEKMKIWGKKYFDLYDSILAKNDLPVELKYLSVIESHLRRKLVSNAGAMGPWQLMPDEAKRYKLKMTKGRDERCDFAKSTQAACYLLKELYGEFGDWLLVVAAYNGGVGRVKQAIRKSGSRNFWVMQSYLPEQTRNHVKKYIGAHFIFEGGGGWTTLTAAETRTQKENIAMLLGVDPETVAEEHGVVTVSLKGKYQSKIIARKLKLDLPAFQRQNPELDEVLMDGSVYKMRLPSDKLYQFKQQKKAILEECIKAGSQDDDDTENDTQIVVKG